MNELKQIIQLLQLTTGFTDFEDSDHSFNINIYGLLPETAHITRISQFMMNDQTMQKSGTNRITRKLDSLFNDIQLIFTDYGIELLQ